MKSENVTEQSRSQHSLSVPVLPMIDSFLLAAIHKLTLLLLNQTFEEVGKAY